MRTLRLARIAAEAEGLRLRHLTQRAVTRALLGVGALAFLSGTAIFCHIAAWYWLRIRWERPQSALILAGVDLVIAMCLTLLAARSSPGRIELEALAVRQKAIQSVGGTLAFSALAMELLRVGFSAFRRSRRT